MKSVIVGSIGARRTRNEGQADKYLAISNHPPFIDKETFEAVQKEMIQRSHVIRVDGVMIRSDVRYCATKQHSIRRKTVLPDWDRRNSAYESRNT